MKNTKPMRYTDNRQWQPPVRPVDAIREPSGSAGKHLPWFVGVSREPGRLPAAIILPVRLFLAITYLYAGLQKFTDPQYFNSAAPGYVGEEMRGYVRSGSPLSLLLTHVVIPHAAFVGGLIAFCELLVGLSALTGLLTRAGAIGGVAVSVTFYLTASWAVHPYFLGGDLPYAFLWLTLALAGSGPYSLDEYFFGAAVRGRARIAAMATMRQPRRATSKPHGQSPYPTFEARPAPPDAVTRAAVLRGFGTAAFLAVAAGVTGAIAKARTPPSTDTSVTSIGDGTPVAPVATATVSPPPAATAGAVASNGGSLTFPPFGNSTVAPTAPAASGGQSDTAATPTPAPLPRATPATAASPSAALANIASLPANSGARFTDPTSGGPGLLIHLPDGSVVAYSAICTHSGCTVQYSATQKEIVCPCHGAVFDPAHNAQVVRGPARRPLAAILVQVDATGNVLLKNGGA